jgi:hypothetical protein
MLVKRWIYAKLIVRKADARRENIRRQLATQAAKRYNTDNIVM